MSRRAFGNSAEEKGKKLFIGGLHMKTDEDSLRAFYSKWGELTDCVVMRDGATGRSRGFGFVTFATEESVNEAQAARPHEIDGKQVDPKRAMPKEDTAPENHSAVNRLYCGRLPKTVDSDELKQFFSQFGEVTEANVIMNKATNEPRGFAFVTFTDPDTVDKIILSRPHSIGGAQIETKKAVDKNDRQNTGSYQRGGQGGYGQQNNYGGGYQGGYNSQNGGYGAQQGSYGGQQDGYGGWGQQGGGYGAQNGYSGGYASGGYSNGAGYGQQSQPAVQGYGGGYNYPANGSGPVNFGSYNGQQKYSGGPMKPGQSRPNPY